MIVVTTPTGAIGHQVLRQVVESGQPIRVVARDPARLDPEMRDRVEVVQGSHGDPNVVDRAFAGADTVFWLVPPNPHTESLTAAYTDFTRPACDAIRSQGVRRVVAVSALGRGTEWEERAGLVTASLAMENLLMGTGVAFRALAMPSFMDNLLRQVAPIKGQGTFFSPLDGDRKLPTCATRDIASVAAKLLLDREWKGQESVPVLGPEDLSMNDMSRIVSEVLNKPVRHQQIPFEAFKAHLQGNGMSEAFVQGYVDMMRAKNEGLDNAETHAPRSDTPTTFRQWCEEVLKPAVLA